MDPCCKVCGARAPSLISGLCPSCEDGQPPAPLCRLCGLPLVSLTDYDKSGAHRTCIDARARLGELVDAARDVATSTEHARCLLGRIRAERAWLAVDCEGGRD